MKKNVYYLLLSFVLISLSGCPSGGMFDCTRDVSARVGEHTERQRGIKNFFCRGNLAGAAGTATRPPGLDVGQCNHDRNRTPSTHLPTRYYPSLGLDQTPGTVQDPRVANLSCLASGGNALLTDAMGVSTTASAKDNEKAIVDQLVASVVDVAGEENGKHMLRGLSVNIVPHLRLRRNPAGRCLPGHYRLDGSPHLNIARRCHPDAVDGEGNKINQTEDYDDRYITSLLYHEVGHHVGLKRPNYAGPRSTFRDFYRSRVTERCEISHYCGTSHSEEFAEVFAAFMYATDRLKEKCPKSYEFMRDMVFQMPEGSERHCSAGAIPLGPASIEPVSPVIDDDHPETEDFPIGP